MPPEVIGTVQREGELVHESAPPALVMSLLVSPHVDAKGSLTRTTAKKEARQLSRTQTKLSDGSF